MKILGIDPGTTESGWCRLGDDGMPEAFGIASNQHILTDVLPGFMADDWMNGGDDRGRLAIEMIASFGMAVGAETFRTVWWTGRFAQAWMEPLGGDLPMEVFRSEVKLHLCKTTQAKDANIRQALIDLFGGEGGKETAIGRKAAPGPLYGAKSHIWSALAVAVTARHHVLLAKAKAEAIVPITKQLMEAAGRDPGV